MPSDGGGRSDVRTFVAIFFCWAGGCPEPNTKGLLLLRSRLMRLAVANLVVADLVPIHPGVLVVVVAAPAAEAASGGRGGLSRTKTKMCPRIYSCSFQRWGQSRWLRLCCHFCLLGQRQPQTKRKGCSNAIIASRCGWWPIWRPQILSASAWRCWCRSRWRLLLSRPKKGGMSRPLAVFASPLLFAERAAALNQTRRIPLASHTGRWPTHWRWSLMPHRLVVKSCGRFLFARI